MLQSGRRIVQSLLCDVGDPNLDNRRLRIIYLKNLKTTIIDLFIKKNIINSIILVDLKL